MSTYNILQGDCLESLKGISNDSIDCCVTSPPYFGLRDYGCDGQIGIEETPEKFIEKLVEVFREVRRVLKPEGTCWLNIGDTYSRGDRGTVPEQRGAAASKNDDKKYNFESAAGRMGSHPTIKPKDLIGIPWMLAFALRADGWYLRQDIIWNKPNPMPEAVKDRCTRSHEHIFLLSKSPRYYFDNDAIREPCKQRPYDIKRASQKHKGYEGKHASGYNGNIRGQPVGDPNKGRNKRDVWTVPTRPFKGAHFATFPPDLIKPCILAGCPAGGTVIDPFGGSGTTAQVAIQNGRNAILCELNPDYVSIINNRLSMIQPTLFQ